MLAYQAGKLSAFNCVYQRHKDSIYRFFLYHCSSSSYAEDLCQETWTAIINRIEQYQTSAKFKTYLFTVARNKLIDFYRRHSHLDQLSDSYDSVDEELQQAGEHSHSSAQTSQPERHVSNSQIIEQINKLPTYQKQAFILKEEGFSLQEIADISATNTETIKSRLRYARSRLQQLIQAEEVL